MALVALHYTGVLPLAAAVLAGAAGLAAARRALGPRRGALVEAGSLLAVLAVAMLMASRGAAAPAAVALGAAAALASAALSRLLPWSPEKMLRAAALLVVAGWLLYWVPFVTLDFSLHEVFWNTSEGLPLWMRFAAAWSGGGGSLFLFSLFASLGSLYLLRGRAERRSLLVAGASLVIVVGLAAAFLNDAFTLLEKRPVGGAGLNPLLKSPWLYPHPLTTFGGYALLAIASVGLLASGIDRRSWIVYELGWALLTLGIMLGGYWSYETFGWGGYWAWDPVETSELMVWLAATVLPHAAVAARSLTGFVAALTGSSVFLAMYVTRTGLSPLHSFAAPGVGALVLLATGLGFLAYAAYRLAASAEEAGRQLVASVKSLVPYRVAMALAALLLLGAALFVYATLLLPSIYVAAGRPASVPQMDAGAAYFNPVLYAVAVAVLAVIPAAFIGDWLGWRGIAAVEASTGLLAAAMALAAAKGVYTLAPVVPGGATELTNAMMAFGLPWAGLAAAATLAYLVLRARRGGLHVLSRDRLVPMSLLHLGFALTVAGVLLSGAYAFHDQAYSWESYLKPGATVAVAGGHSIELLNYSFGISSSKVDIYTNYVGRSSIYYYAQLGLCSLYHDVAPYFKFFREGQEMLERNQTLRLLFKASHDSPFSVHDAEQDTSINATMLTIVQGGEQGFSFNQMPLYQGAAHVKVVNASIELIASARAERDQVLGVQPVGWLGAVIHLGLIEAGFEHNITPPKRFAASHDMVELRFDPPLVLRVNDTFVLEVREARLLPEVLVHPSPEAQPINITATGIAARNALMLVYNGTLRLSNITVETPLRLPDPVAGYLAVLQDQQLLGLILFTMNTSIYRLLSQPSIIKNITTPPRLEAAAGSNPHAGLGACDTGILDGYVAAPKEIPETAWLDVLLRVDGRDTLKLRIRFEAYGEIQGIHGLVSKVVHPSRGLDDVYVVVGPPTVPGALSGSPYHELMLYYLHEVFKQLPPEKRLALAALMAAGYNIDVLNKLGPDAARARLEASIIDLYVSAEKYDPAKGTVATQGVHVKVRLIPGVRLVWLGPVVMSLSVVAAALQAAGFSVKRGRSH